jgi:hypothetical protein
MSDVKIEEPHEKTGDTVAPENKEKEAELAEIHRKESTNCQASKLLLNWGALFFLTLVSILRGDGKAPSIVGLTSYTMGDWVALVILALGLVGLTVVAIKGVLLPESAAK